MALIRYLFRRFLWPVLLVAASISGTAIALGWSERQQPRIVMLVPDSLMVSFPVCYESRLLLMPPVVRPPPPVLP